MKKYWPLATLIFVAAFAAIALSLSTQERWMIFFMGFSLCLFAMVKIFHLNHFVEAFEMYDLVAGRSRMYAFLYPFIELALGLLFLAAFLPKVLCVIIVCLFGVSAVGVIRALIKGLDVRCACMGTVLDVPLSTVSLIEDLGMIAMAFYMLY